MTAILSGHGIHFDGEAQVVIIGAGACGLTAALAAHDAGADVLVLERDDSPSGSTALSSGFVPAAPTRFQTCLGIADTAAEFAEDIQRKSGGTAPEDLVGLVADASGPTVEWLADAHGLEWIVLDDFLYPGHSHHRMHAMPERTGTALMARLLAASETAGIAIATGAHVTALHADDGIVRGVQVTRPDGTTETIGCRSLILACNGYGGNPAMVTRHVPDMADAIYFGHSGNQGDAVVWGTGLGAAVNHLSGYQGHGSVAHPHGILITWALMMEGGVQVNIRGERFSNEHAGYSEQAAHVLAQPEGIAWNIYDRRLHELGQGFEDYRNAEAVGAIRHGGDAAELAANTALPAAALKATLSQVTEMVGGISDDVFGRGFTSKPALAPPYYAVKVTGALFHTQGGLMIDRTARVIRPDGTPMPNLYAGGGAACGVSGPRASGYLSGNGLLTAITLGWIAGTGAS